MKKLLFWRLIRMEKNLLHAVNRQSTAITSADFLITLDRDETVEGFVGNFNKKIGHLPSNLGDLFPNVLVLEAGWCSIKAITKESFKGLIKLRELDLKHNQLEKIDDDTFEFIPEVEIIHLGWNKINKINGRAFASLSKFKTVYLNDNECINEDFDGAEVIAEMPRVVTSKCG